MSLRSHSLERSGRFSLRAPCARAARESWPFQKIRFYKIVNTRGLFAAWKERDGRSSAFVFVLEVVLGAIPDFLHVTGILESDGGNSSIDFRGDGSFLLG